MTRGNDRVVRTGLSAFALAMSALSAALGVASGAAGQVNDPFTTSPIADEVFYQFMPIAWRDSNGNPSTDPYRYGDFAGMTASLDYLQSLGVTSVWMTPIFPSAAYHGYQHGPADQINSWFGDETGFRSFLAAAKAKGIKVYLDFVAYGISQNTPYFLRGAGGFSGGAYNNRASQYDTWLAFTDTNNTQYQGYTFTTWSGANVGFIHWDLRDPSPRNLVTQWGRKWLDPDGNGVADDGVAGYRFDHCWVSYPNGPSGWGYNLDSFWAPFFASLRQLKPNVIVFGEQADWGTPGGEFLSQFDAMFTMPFQFAARDALSSGNASGLYSSMNTALASARSAGRGTFLGIIGNHDNDRLASVIGANTASTLPKMKAAAAVLLLQPFPPCIYFGDELGMLGRKGSFGSDADDIPFREPFKWKAVAGSPMSNYFAQNAGAFAARYERDNDGRSVEEQDNVSGSTLNTFRGLAALRKSRAALRRGDYAAIPNSAGSVWAFQRRYAPGGAVPESLVVAINLSGSSVTTNLNVSGFTLPAAGAPVTDIVSGATLATITTANRAAYSVTIPAYGYRVLSASLTPPAPPVSIVSGDGLPARVAPPQALALQTAPTNLGDNVGELDQLLVKGEAGGVRIGITGNLPGDYSLLALFIESAPGGVSQVYTADQPSPPNGLAQLTGTRFDPGFAPNHLLLINGSSSAFYVDQVSLFDTFSTKVYRGSGLINSGSGLLSGGDADGGVQVAIRSTNTSGVTGASVANAATATAGIEVFLPFDALGRAGDACSPVRVSAMLVRGSGAVSSQVLPGAGTTATDRGTAPNFAAIAGDQFVSVARLAGCPFGCGMDFNGDRAINLDDLGDFITEFYTVPPAPAGPQPAATFAGVGMGYTAPCPEAPDAPPPYPADAYRVHGYRTGFTSDGSNACPLGPSQGFPNLDALGDFLTAFYSLAPC